MSDHKHPIDRPFFVPVWRHLKTGGLYLLLDTPMCRIESSNTPAVQYVSLETGQVWVRPGQEFHDGRFEQLTYEQYDAMKDATYG